MCCRTWRFFFLQRILSGEKNVNKRYKQGNNWKNDPRKEKQRQKAKHDMLKTNELTF